MQVEHQEVWPKKWVGTACVSVEHVGVRFIFGHAQFWSVVTCARLFCMNCSTAVGLHSPLAWSQTR
jgi:hypothetical protein